MKKCNTLLFEKPDSISGGYDSEIIQEVNKRLLEDPDAEIPKGYVKKFEKRIEYSYNLPNTFPIDEPYRVAYETFDLIINDMLGFHVMEPLSEIYLIAKIEPKKKKKAKSTYMDTSKWLSKIEERAAQKDKQDPKSFKVGNYLTRKLKMPKKYKLR